MTYLWIANLIMGVLCCVWQDEAVRKKQVDLSLLFMVCAVVNFYFGLGGLLA